MQEKVVVRVESCSCCTGVCGSSNRSSSGSHGKEGVAKVLP